MSHLYENIVQSIQEEHVVAATQYIRSPSILNSLCTEIQSECQDLLGLLVARSPRTVGEMSASPLDNIICKGEILSCRIVTALLQDYGVDAQFVDLSNVIPLKLPPPSQSQPQSQLHSQSLPQSLSQDFYDNLAFLLYKKIEECGNRIPVVTGYFGNILGGLVETVGRGYTDLCGALLAVGLKAEELQVWKEVDGIFTADPRKVPTASLLDTISPAEAAELTFYGSEVIHPFTMEQLIKARIAIRIKNVTNPRGGGTQILPEPVESLGPGDLSHSSKPVRPKRPTAITIKNKILVLNVHSNKRSLSHGFFAKIFSTLDTWRLSIDLISTSEVHVSMAIHSDKKDIDEDLKGAIKELRQYGSVDLIHGMAIISLVGNQMKNMIGIAGKMFTTLGEHNINIGEETPNTHTCKDTLLTSHHHRNDQPRYLFLSR